MKLDTSVHFLVRVRSFGLRRKPGGAAQGLAGAAQELRSFGGITGNVLPNFLTVADTVARSARLLESSI
jgi:hypothetical protein